MDNELNNKSTKNTNSSESPTCDLCGLRLPPKPPTTDWNNKEYKFCCSGCRQVFIILAESGMLEGDYKNSDVYKTSLKLGIIAQTKDEAPAKSKKQEETKKIDPETLKDTKELTVHIGGMWCSACSWLIDKVVEGEDGVVSTQVIFAADSAKIRYQPQIISAEQIKNIINKLGYKAVDRAESSSEVTKEKNDLLLKMGVAIFFAINIMMLNSVLYIGYFEEVSARISRLLVFILWGFATPAVFWCGLSIHIKAFYSLRAKAPTMEVLLSIGILTAYFFSIYVIFINDTHVYFDTSASLVALILIGKYFEISARHQATGDIHRLYQMLPKKVRIKTPQVERLTAIEQLQANDIFVVKPGEKVPSDGVIIKGETSIDESLLTGESKPIRKKVGMKVVGSAMNLSGTIEVCATHIGEETTIAKIIKLVENALTAKSQIERIVDKISRWFIPAVISISLITLFSLIFSGGSLGTSIMRSLTVIVIACPCALGIATPLALMAGIGFAAKNGILIRDGAVFQKAAKLSTLFFDKTGTITTGHFSLLNHISSDDKKTGQYLQLIGSLEKASNHPIGSAIVKYCTKENIKLFENEGITFYEGKGLSGKVKNIEIYIGNRALFDKFKIVIPKKLIENGQEEQLRGNTVIYYHIKNKDSFGSLVLGDQLNPLAKETISKVHENNISTYLISGDSENTTRTIASQVGISNYSSELTPQDKIAEIKKIQSSENLVGMVGDGINDAPSLAQADIGIAIGSGTELAIESSDIILLSNNLLTVYESLNISKRTIRTIKQNLLWAFLYNSIGMVVAVSGYLNPLMAASAMLISSISVVLNSLRLHAGPGKARKKVVEIFLPWIDFE